MKRRDYTEAEEAQLFKLRQEGKSFEEISQILKRGVSGVKFKYSRIKKKAKIPRRKYTKRKVETQPTVATQKPMIAFVGNPGEVTTAIRELFS